MFNTDNRINYGSALENMIYLYSREMNYFVSVGRIGKRECDFILRDTEQNYSYIQVAYTINESKQTEEREYRPYQGTCISGRPGRYLAWAKAWLKCHSAIPHDFLICARAAEENGFWQLDEELAYHRRRNANVGGEEHRLKKLLNKGRKLKEIEKYRKILGAFTEDKVLRTEHGKNQLIKKVEAVEGRYHELCSEKNSAVVKNARKHKSDTRIATVVCDVAIVRQALRKEG